MFYFHPHTGHYVKGKILSEMKRFQEAEDSFLKSLQYDDCLGKKFTEKRIRMNIYSALIDDGFDACISDHAAAKQCTIEDAKNYLLSGAFVFSLQMTKGRKSAEYEKLCRKCGRLLPLTWFNRSVHFRHK